MFKGDFKYLFASQVLSQLTVNMMNILLLSRLFTITGSSIATSLLWVSYALPSIFAGPIGAASVDFIDRKKVLIITNFLQALVIFIYIFMHQTSIFLLYLVVVIYSFLNQFYLPAEAASLPSVVKKADLARANSLFFITQQLALVIGFGMGGIAQRIIGFKGSLILCSIFLFLAFLSVTFLPRLKTGKRIPRTVDKIIEELSKSILEGYSFIKDKKYILYPFILFLGTQVGLTMVVVNLPQIASEILKVSVNYAGLLIVVPAGIGALAGSVFIPRFLKKGMRKRSIIGLGLIVLLVSLLGIVFLIPHLPTTFRVIINPVLTIAAGLGFIAVNIPTLTFLQEVTPLELRGRVFGNMWFLITIITVFPVLLSGAVAEFFGVRALLVILSLFILFALFILKRKEHLPRWQ